MKFLKAQYSLLHRSGKSAVIKVESNEMKSVVKVKYRFVVQ